jgi:hypothetical protein
MREILRKASLVAVAMSSLAFTGSPAGADGVGAGGFRGTASVDCFGCGTSRCHAVLTVVGAAAAGSESTTEWPPPLDEEVPTPEELPAPLDQLPAVNPLPVAPILGSAATGQDPDLANPVDPCTANEPADVTCVVTGTASGKVLGVIDVDFNWTRVGATAVITTSGDISGAGAAVFIVTDPHGNPCGVEVTAEVVGVLAGTTP